MQHNIKLNVKQLKILFKDLFNEKHMDTQVVDSILCMLNDSQVELLLHIMSTPDYKLLSLNQKIKFKPDKYDFDQMNVDILQDLGYVDKDGYHFGKIIADTSYGNDFNPTYYKMKIECVGLDEDSNTPKKLILEVYTKEIIAADIEDSIESSTYGWKGLE